MAYLAVDKNGDEVIYEDKPRKSSLGTEWITPCDYVHVPQGTIQKILGYELTWDDEPVELK